MARRGPLVGTGRGWAIGKPSLWHPLARPLFPLALQYVEAVEAQQQLLDVEQAPQADGSGTL